MRQYIVFLTCFILLCMTTANAQQIIESEILRNAGTNENCLFSPTTITHGDVYDNKIQLKQMDAGQSGYTEFSYNHFDNSDIFVGLRNLNDNSQQWGFQFVNGQVWIDGVDYGSQASGVNYKVERCDPSIRFYIDNLEVHELSLLDINFPVEALIEVTVADYVSSNKPSIHLEFPFLNNCTAQPTGMESNQMYTLMERQPDGGYLRITEPKIHIKYIEEYAIVPNENETFDFEIFTWDDKVNPIHSGSLFKTMGVNELIVFPNNITYNTYYLLQAKDSKGVKYYLRFYYYCPPGLNCPLNNIVDNQPQDK